MDYVQVLTVTVERTSGITDDVIKAANTFGTNDITVSAFHYSF